MNRRNALGILAVAGIGTLTRDTDAASAAAIAQVQHGFKLMPILVRLFHQLIHAEEAFIKDYLVKAIATYARVALVAAIVAREGTVDAGSTAKLTVSVKPHHDKKHLRVSATIEDSQGNHQVVHEGIATHAKHPDMIRHLDEMVRKSHQWLLARNQ
jgi:hypothetical protein